MWKWDRLLHRALRGPYSLWRVCGFFNVPQIYYTCKGLWDGAYGLSSLWEKTRESNHLQMLLQGQHFLLSYLKTQSVGAAGFEPTASRSADQRLSHCANWVAVSSGYQRFFLVFFLSQVFFLSEVFAHVQREVSFRQPHVIVKWCIKGCHFHAGHILDLTETENRAWKASGTQGMLIYRTTFNTLFYYYMCISDSPVMWQLWYIK